MGSSPSTNLQILTCRLAHRPVAQLDTSSTNSWLALLRAAYRRICSRLLSCRWQIYYRGNQNIWLRRSEAAGSLDRQHRFHQFAPETPCLSILDLPRELHILTRE